MAGYKYSRLRKMLLFGCLPGITLLFSCSNSYAQRKGQPVLISQCRVTEPTRLDWVFAVGNQSTAKAPPGQLEYNDSTKQRF